MIKKFLVQVTDKGYLIATLEVKGLNIRLCNVKMLQELQSDIIGVKRVGSEWVGSNGSLDRYKGNCIVILFKLIRQKESYFYCCIPTEQQVIWLSVDKIINMVNSQGYRLANGKILMSNKDSYYISSLEGNFLELKEFDSNGRKEIKRDNVRTGVCNALQRNGIKEEQSRINIKGIRGSNVAIDKSRKGDNSCRDRIDRALRGLNISVNDKATPQEILDVTSRAKSTNKYGCCVDVHSIEDYAEYKSLITFNKDACVAVKDDGDIVNLAKSSDSDIKGFVKVGMYSAIKQGGTKCDCYNIGGGLPASYCRCGFVPVCRVSFMDEFAPDDWDYNALGRPEIVFMAYCGDTSEDMYYNHGKGYKSFADYNYDSLPLFEGEDGYDKAWSYRDKCMKEGNLPSAHTSDFESVNKISKINNKVEDYINGIVNKMFS